MMAQGSLRPSTSPWASLIVLVLKKDGFVHPCVAYGRVNAVTIKDASPLPHMQDGLDAVAGLRYFSTLDIISAYNQIPVKEEDIPKTAFITRHGLFEYTTMPFGLCNAPAMFQRIMKLALNGLQWSTCVIYLADVIMFRTHVDEYLGRLREVLKRIEQANLKLKLDKWHLLQRSVRFLGHILSVEGVLPYTNNVQRIVDWPQPKTATDGRALLGLGNYYRHFVKDFSELMPPLTKLTMKDQEFLWDAKCEAAFQQLKAVLTGPVGSALEQCCLRSRMETNGLLPMGAGPWISQSETIASPTRSC